MNSVINVTDTMNVIQYRIMISIFIRIMVTRNKWCKGCNIESWIYFSFSQWMKPDSPGFCSVMWVSRETRSWHVPFTMLTWDRSGYKYTEFRIRSSITFHRRWQLVIIYRSVYHKIEHRIYMFFLMMKRKIRGTRCFPSYRIANEQNWTSRAMQ